MTKQLVIRLASTTCLAVAAIVGASNAQADLVIDGFDDGEQTTIGGGNTVDTALGIGGKRFMESSLETQGFVLPTDTVNGRTGVQNANTTGNLGGTVNTIWNGGDTLQGFDLTESGANRFFRLDIAFVSGSDGRLDIVIIDSDGEQGSIMVDFDDLTLGANDFAFSSLPSQVNLDSVDEIQLNYTYAGTGSIFVGSFSAVPEPSSVVFLGLLAIAIGAVGVRRRRILTSA